jgi:hypothetical protein
LILSAFFNLLVYLQQRLSTESRNHLPYPGSQFTGLLPKHGF